MIPVKTWELVSVTVETVDPKLIFVRVRCRLEWTWQRPMKQAKEFVWSDWKPATVMLWHEGIGQPVAWPNRHVLKVRIANDGQVTRYRPVQGAFRFAEPFHHEFHRVRLLRNSQSQFE